MSNLCGHHTPCSEPLCLKEACRYLTFPCDVPGNDHETYGLSVVPYGTGVCRDHKTVGRPGPYNEFKAFGRAGEGSPELYAGFLPECIIDKGNKMPAHKFFG